MTKHTPTPWGFQGKYQICGNNLSDNGGYVIADCIGDDRLANADHIVRCVNLHAELVEALEESIHFILKHKFDENIQKAGDAMRTENKIRTILAKARGRVT